MQFLAKLDELPKMLQFIKEHAKEIGIQPERIKKLELASEEALVNIISHAYVKESFLGRVDIECRKNDHFYELVLIDKGLPFNPIESAPKVQKDLPIEDRPIGGLGIYLIAQLMDEVVYTRSGEENILMLKMLL